MFKKKKEFFCPFSFIPGNLLSSSVAGTYKSLMSEAADAGGIGCSKGLQHLEMCLGPYQVQGCCCDTIPYLLV